MSTPGSVHSGTASGAQYTPPAAGQGAPAAPAPRRVRLFRWQGIVPLVLGAVLAFLGWTLFGGAILRSTLEEAGTEALGAELDVGAVEIGLLSTTLELRDVALADPFDVNRNLFEIGVLRVEIEPRPLLQKKLVVRRLTVDSVRTGTRRETPAQVVGGGGFAPRALAEMQRFASQFKVPLLSLTPFDTLKAVALNPSQLQSVQAALALGRSADSVRSALESGYAALRLQETVDSSAAVIARLQGLNVRTLGLDGVRRAVSDLRAAAARVDSARRRVDALVVDARRGSDTLQARTAAINDARREDYAFARGLLKLPSFDAPDIGASLFGAVTIDKFQQALYWATLAREHAPPGLLPRESAGPKRLRRSGTTVQFVERESYPQFLLRRADVRVQVTSGAASGEYAMAAANVTSQPAVLGEPTVFAIRRVGAGGPEADSVRITGALDHLGAEPRDLVNVRASGVKLPRLAMPVLPLALDPGRGSMEMRFQVDGTALNGFWSVRSGEVSWIPDSSRVRPLNEIETLVSRALTGIHDLELTADVGGTISAPTLSVRSSLDRQVADRLRAVMGEEVAAMQSRVRQQVDSLAEEQLAPVRAKIADVRAEADRRIADARSRLDAEKRKLEDRLRELGGGLALPGIGR